MDELRTALSEDSVLEPGEIETIIAEVDTDHVRAGTYLVFEPLFYSLTGSRWESDVKGGGVLRGPWSGRMIWCIVV